MLRPILSFILRPTSVVLFLLLAACEIPPQQRDSSPFYLVPPGSKFTLNQDILIPANSLKIFIQDGRLVYSPNQYYPYCKFSLRELKDHPQLVKADEFDIFKTWQVADLFAAIDTFHAFPVFADISISSNDRGAPTPIVYGTEMDLHSATQPQVFRMMCGHLQDPNLTARYLSVDQMREALGGIFTLQLPGDLKTP